MCLLVAIYRSHPEAALLVAANRDELLSRPATAMTVLRERDPRILGGRDEVAGGTWLAVNELGLVAGLTNLPAGHRDAGKRSRGEWPIFLTGFASPRVAATDFVDRYDPADFNPGWLLVGNASELVYIDMTAGRRGRLVELQPGIHILENSPLEAESAKAEMVRTSLVGIDSLSGTALIERLTAVLSSHRTPPPSDRSARRASGTRPAAADAACVHLERYGTRSATIVQVAGPGEPRVWSSSGPPCTHETVEVTSLWQRSARRASSA